MKALNGWRSGRLTAPAGSTLPWAGSPTLWNTMPPAVIVTLSPFFSTTPVGVQALVPGTSTILGPITFVFDPAKHHREFAVGDGVAIEDVGASKGGDRVAQVGGPEKRGPGLVTGLPGRAP